MYWTFSDTTEQLLKATVTQALATEAVYRTEIRAGHPGEPHVVHVLVQQALHSATRVDIAHVGIHNYLQEHPRMVATRAAAHVGRLYAGFICYLCTQIGCGLG